MSVLYMHITIFKIIAIKNMNIWLLRIHKYLIIYSVKRYLIIQVNNYFLYYWLHVIKFASVSWWVLIQLLAKPTYEKECHIPNQLNFLL